MAEIVIFCDVCGTGINLLVGDKVALCKKCGKKVCAGCAEKEGKEPQCYCSACVAPCFKCGSKRQSEGLKQLEANGKMRNYCEPCYTKSMKPCHACQKPTLIDEMSKVGDGIEWEFYCKACVPKEVETCTKCGNVIHAKEVTKINKTLGKSQVLCKGCVND